MLIHSSRRPKGYVEYSARNRRGEIIENLGKPNLIVQSGIDLFPTLMVGGNSSKLITKIGFGSSSDSAKLTDTNLTNKYSKALDSYKLVSNTIVFSWNLAYYENNESYIQELGLFSDDETTLIARWVMSNSIFKTDEISLSGTWTIEF